MGSLGQGLALLLVQALTPLIWNLMTSCAGPGPEHALTASLGKGNTKWECKGVQNPYKAQQVVFDAAFYCARSHKIPALWRILCAPVTQREEAHRKSCLAGCSPFGDISGG